MIPIFITAFVPLALGYAKLARISPYFLHARVSYGGYPTTLTLRPHGFTREWAFFKTDRPWCKGDTLTIAASPALRGFRADPDYLLVIISAGRSADYTTVLLKVHRKDFPALAESVAAYAGPPGHPPRLVRTMHAPISPKT